MAEDAAGGEVQKVDLTQTRSPTPPDPFQVPVNPATTPYNLLNSGPTPVLTGPMTFRELGQSGLRAFAGWVKEEFLLELQARQGAQKYREMRDNSPIIGAIMFAIESTMRKVEWRVIPANDSGEAQEAADFLDSCRNDMSQTWEETIVENLSMLTYGYAPHEIVYKRRMGKYPNGKGPDGLPLASSDYDDGKIGWRRLPLRGQDTVLKWFFDFYGQVTGMTQLPWVGSIRDIPIEKMLLFRPSVHKGNPEGRSVLRNSYASFYYVKRLQEQEAIFGERLGGLPVVKVPSQLIEAAKNGDANSAAAYETFKKMATNVRIDEQMGAVIPSDMWPGPNGPSNQPMFALELLSPSGGGGRGAAVYETAIGRYNVNMMTSVLADFLSLGHEARGTQSLAVTKVDLFFQAIEGFLNMVAGVYNRYGVPRLWRLNGMDMNTMPTLEPDLAQRVDLDVLSNFVLRVAQAGMPLFPNDEVQSFLMDAAGMPDVTDPRALQFAGMTDDQLDAEQQKDQLNLQGQQQQLEGQQQQQQMAQESHDQQMAQPVKPAPGSNLQKMLLASILRRQNRLAGPRFGVHTHKRVYRNTHRRKFNKAAGAL